MIIKFIIYSKDFLPNMILYSRRLIPALMMIKKLSSNQCQKCLTLQ